MPSFPNRCQHIKINGTQCGSPALRRNRFCYFHKRFQDERIKLSADRARRGVATFELPVLEDANSIQIVLMQVMRLLVSGQLDHKTASLLLYALQTASTNLRMTKFDPRRHDVILDPHAVADTQLDEHIWSDDDFEEEEEEQEDLDDEAEEPKASPKRIANSPKKSPREELTPIPAVTAAGSAVALPAIPPKKPAQNTSKNSIGQKIADEIRSNFPAHFPQPVTSTG